LKKFEIFPELGQLSLFGPEPQKEKGEIWETHFAKPITRNNETICLSEDNIAATCIIRKELLNKGLRWNTRNITHDTDILLPADGGFSIKIKKLGFWVAWNDKYTVINWGHNVKEWAEHLDYYLEVYRAKASVWEEGMKQRLIDN